MGIHKHVFMRDFKMRFTELRVMEDRGEQCLLKGTRTY